MEKQSFVHIGGDIEKAVRGEYDIDVGAVLNEAWQKTKTTRRPIISGLAIIMLFGMMVSFLVSNYFGGPEAVLTDPALANLLNILITLVIWPFMAGVEMMGVLHAVGLKTRTNLIFAFLRRGSWVAICAVITSVLISLGLQFFVIPGIFLAVALSLTIPLVVEKRMSPLKSIVISIKATRFQWFKLFAIYGILVLVTMVCALPLAILANNGNSTIIMIAMGLFLFCLTYLAPWYYNVKGVLYREIFGMTMQKVDTQEAVQSDDIFTA